MRSSMLTKHRSVKIERCKLIKNQTKLRRSLSSGSDVESSQSQSKSTCNNSQIPGNDEIKIMHALTSWCHGEDITTHKKESKKDKIKNLVSTRYSHKFEMVPNQSSFTPIGFTNLQSLMSSNSRITPKIALFYLKQHLNEEFPDAILEHMFIQHNNCIDSLKKTLIQRGWKLKLRKQRKSKYPSMPVYYFGAWSYDCWSILEGQSPGSFITCFSKDEYYVIYVNAKGSVEFRPMYKGPHVSYSILTECCLTTELIRPAKRYICKACGKNTPCDLVNPSPLHKSEWMDYTLSYRFSF